MGSPQQKGLEGRESGGLLPDRGTDPSSLLDRCWQPVAGTEPWNPGGLRGLQDPPHSAPCGRKARRAGEGLGEGWAWLGAGQQIMSLRAELLQSQ